MANKNKLIAAVKRYVASWHGENNITVMDVIHHIDMEAALADADPESEAHEKLSFDVVIDAVRKENNWATKRWTEADERNNVADYVLYIKRYIRRIEDSNDPSDTANSLRNMLKIANLAIACMQKHGVVETIRE